MPAIKVSFGTYSESEKEFVRVAIGTDMHSTLKNHAEERYRKKISELTFDEAITSVSNLIATLGRSGLVERVIKDGQIAVDAQEDGQEASSGFAMNESRTLLPKIDDERDLFIQVVKDPTIWEAIRRREPQVEQQYIFRNEPREYV